MTPSLPESRDMASAPCVSVNFGGVIFAVFERTKSPEQMDIGSSKSLEMRPK